MISSKVLKNKGYFSVNPAQNRQFCKELLKSSVEQLFQVKFQCKMSNEENIDFFVRANNSKNKNGMSAIGKFGRHLNLKFRRYLIKSQDEDISSEISFHAQRVQKFRIATFPILEILNSLLPLAPCHVLFLNIFYCLLAHIESYVLR